MLSNPDATFLADFEACRIPISEFRHREHLRAAWALIKRHGFSEATVMMEASVRRLAAHHNRAQKYRHTMTAVWMQLVAAHALQHPAPTFDTFIEEHSCLLDQSLIERFYSREALFSDHARVHWIEPDLRPLPGMA
jgi:hypothetical protein